MKKILLTLVLGMFMISLISAYTIDDIKSYDDNKLEYDLTNAWGLGEHIATVRLDSPEFLNTGLGYQQFAEVPIVNGESDYEEIVKGFELYYINKGMKEFERQIDVKYKVITQVDVQVYDLASCKERLMNGTTEKYDCYKTEMQDKISWEPFTKNSLLKEEEITLGFFTTMYEGDLVEWVPIMYGNERLTKWAIWNASIETDLISWFPLDELTGATANDVKSGNDGTSAIVSLGELGIKNYSYNFTDVVGSKIEATLTGLTTGNNARSVNYWVNVRDFGKGAGVTFGTNVNSQKWVVYIEATSMTSDLGSDIDGAPWTSPTDEWLMMTFVYTTDKQVTIYQNGTNIMNLTHAGVSNLGSTDIDINLKNFGTGGANATYDEISIYNRALSVGDIVQLYKNRNALGYNETFEVVIDFPITTTYNSLISDLNYTVYGNGDRCWNSINGGATNSSTVPTGLNFTGVVSTEGSNTWTLYCNSSIGDLYDDSVTFIVDTIIPEVIITSPAKVINYSRVNSNLNLSWEITEPNIDTIYYNHNGTNTSVVGLINSTQFTIESLENNNLTFFANDTIGQENTTFIEWDYMVFENQKIHNATSFETAIESFVINVTANTSLTAVALVYNGTEFSATQSGELWSKSLTLSDKNIGNNSIYWKFTYGGQTINSDNSSQVVNETIFGLCNTTLITPYINFTFKDEEDDSSILASIPNADFNYSLGGGTVTKSLNFINNTANPSYAFCFSPSDRTLNVDMSVQYKNTSGYPQRTYETLKSLTNITTNQTLYLLSSTDGIYVTFSVINSATQEVSGVSVKATRVLGSETITIGDGTTDASGSVTFWMNPDFSHTMTFEKTGYTTYSTSLFPTQSLYTITLGQGAVTSTTTDYSLGIKETLRPSNTFLKSNTVYNFNYTINSSYWALDSFGLVLKYDNNTIIGENSSTISTGGIVSFGANTFNSSAIIMDYYYVVNSTAVNRTSIFFQVEQTEGNEFSIFRFFTDINLYMDENMFGIMGDSGTDYFGKALVVFLLLVLSVGALSYRYGIQSEQAILGFMMGIVLFINQLDFLDTPTFIDVISIGDLLVYIVGMILVVTIMKEELR